MESLAYFLLENFQRLLAQSETLLLHLESVGFILLSGHLPWGLIQAARQVTGCS